MAIGRDGSRKLELTGAYRRDPVLVAQTESGDDDVALRHRHRHRAELSLLLPYKR